MVLSNENKKMNLNYSVVCFIVFYLGGNVVSESVQNFENVLTPAIAINFKDVQATLSESIKTLAVNSKDNDMLSNLNVTRNTDDTCPTLENAADLTQMQLMKELTAPCRYDRLQRPYDFQDGSIVDAPVHVNVRVHVNVLQNLETSYLQFRLQGLVQFRYNDPRLAFERYAPFRDQAIVGESAMRSLIWVPNIFLANEHDSGVLGTNEKDKLTTVSPNGTVIISTRMQATLFCWMNLQKFPFDEQFCPTILESWMYNASELLLHWEQNAPITFDPKMEMTEFIRQGSWTNEAIINADLDDIRNGASVGQYSSLSFTVHLTREVGHYIMDYFLPSIIIVAVSWLTFMLKGDQTSARSTVGTTTMVAFITLASRQESNLPKVNYVKISEVWFLVCIVFIFCSIVEYGFVYTIWYRKYNVVVQKGNSMSIFRAALLTAMDENKMVDTSKKSKSSGSIATGSSSIEESTNAAAKNSSQTMTPQEVSLWIDRKSRWVFPLLFLIFNTIFWILVYVLE